MAEYEGVRAISNSSIEISFYYKGVRCRPRIKRSSTNANKKYCSQLRSKILMEIDEGTFCFEEYFPDHPLNEKFSPALSFQPLIDSVVAYVESYDKIQPTTKKIYLRSLELLRTKINVRVGELTKKHILEISETWTDSRTGKPVTRKTINNHWIPVRKFYNEKASREDIQNPFYGWVLNEGVKNKKPEIDPFSKDEIDAICTSGSITNMVQFGYWTGVRLSELFALKWEDIDWLHSKVEVCRAHVLNFKKDTKTDAGERVIDLLPPALKSLEDQKQHTFLSSEYIFTHPVTNKPFMTDREFRDKIWTPLLRKAKVKYRPPKQLRHTFATIAILSGENIYWVSKMLGHADPAFTMRVYYRWMEKVAEEGGKLMLSKMLPNDSENQRITAK